MALQWDDSYVAIEEVYRIKPENSKIQWWITEYNSTMRL